MTEIKKLGRYEIIEVLGQGAMGIVYKGIDPKIGRTVALKTLRTQGDIPENQLKEFKRRFSQEARSAGRLSHPNIVTVYDVGEENDVAYIAMEFIQGRSLDDIIRERRPLSIDQIVTIMIQVCEGLAYAHKNGVIHRDIKPANIVLTDDGVAKITDFGIAKISSTTATQTGVIVGTPSYMSPEQITGKGVDNRSDIFSLGAVFYELLTYEKAFPGDNITTVMYRVCNENPSPVSLINVSLPAQFSPIIQKALAKYPAERYPDAEMFARDIRNYSAVAAQEMGATVVLDPTPSREPVAVPGAFDGPPGGLSSTGWRHTRIALPIVGILLLSAVYFLFWRSGPDQGDAAAGPASLDIRLNLLDGEVLFGDRSYPIVDARVHIPEVAAAEYDLTIRHGGYRDFKTRLLFAQGEQKKLDVTLKSVPPTIPAGVDTAYVTVTATPQIVRVLTSTGAFVGFTPLTALPFPSGKHTLVFAREDFISQTMNVELRKNQTTSLKAALDAKQGRLSIAEVRPADVSVFIDEVLQKPEMDGTTFDLPAGRHHVAIRKDGYRSYEHDVIVTDTALVRVTATLEAIFGSLSVVSDPTDADVFLDGEKRGKTPYKLEKMPAGSHDVKIQKGALIGTTRVSIQENELASVALKLVPGIGWVKILVNPWAKIYVDGREEGVSPPLDRLELKPGTYQIKIENPAFKPVTRTVTVTPGGTTSVVYDFQ